MEVLGDGTVSVRLVGDRGRDRYGPSTIRIDVNVARVEDLICHG